MQLKVCCRQALHVFGKSDFAVRIPGGSGHLLRDGAGDRLPADCAGILESMAVRLGAPEHCGRTAWNRKGLLRVVQSERQNAGSGVILGNRYDHGGPERRDVQLIGLCRHAHDV